MREPEQTYPVLRIRSSARKTGAQTQLLLRFPPKPNDVYSRKQQCNGNPDQAGSERHISCYEAKLDCV